MRQNGAKVLRITEIISLTLRTSKVPVHDLVKVITVLVWLFVVRFLIELLTCK